MKSKNVEDYLHKLKIGKLPEPKPHFILDSKIKFMDLKICVEFAEEDARERAVKTFIKWLGEIDEPKEGYINAFIAIYDKID